MKTGIELIAEERQRQIDVEGYDEQHDSHHNSLDLMQAVDTYLNSADLTLRSKKYSPSSSMYQGNLQFMYHLNLIKRNWPWEEETFKPTTAIRDLVKAGSLIAAAIDRLQKDDDQQ